MSEPTEPKGENKSAERTAIVEAALAPGGVIYDIAQAAVTEGAQLSPIDVVNVIVPPKQPGDKNQPRYELLDNSKQAIKEASSANAERVYELAEQLGLRKEESVNEADTQSISRDNAVWMVEGGANRTSVVRRQLAVETISYLFPETAEDKTIFQFGSNRPIPRQKNGRPNPEYTVAQEIAGNHLPDDDSLTEFGLALASALQTGYRRADAVMSNKPESIEKVTLLKKEGLPLLVLVQPKGDKLTDGIDSVYETVTSYRTRQSLDEPPVQPVIFTNGQYRAKSELQADKWAADKGIDILPPVALGDEPGYKVQHNGQEIVTAERPPVVYVTEVAILHRMQNS